MTFEASFSDKDFITANMRGDWLAQRELWEKPGIASGVNGVIVRHQGCRNRRTIKQVGAGIIHQLQQKHAPFFRRMALRMPLAMTKREVTSSRVPEAFQKYTILHISDTHLDGTPEMFERLRRVAASMQVDAVILTGDYIADHFDHKAGPEVVKQLGALVREINPRDGAFAVLGNHDYGAMGALLEKEGIHFLANESTSIQRGQALLRITGTDDPYRFYSSAADMALDQKEPRQSEEFRIAAIHTCELAAVAAQKDYDFYLSGHNPWRSDLLEVWQACVRCIVASAQGTGTWRLAYRSNARLYQQWCRFDPAAQNELPGRSHAVYFKAIGCALAV